MDVALECFAKSVSDDARRGKSWVNFFSFESFLLAPRSPPPGEFFSSRSKSRWKEEEKVFSVPVFIDKKIFFHSTGILEGERAFRPRNQHTHDASGPVAVETAAREKFREQEERREISCRSGQRDNVEPDNTAS